MLLSVREADADAPIAECIQVSAELTDLKAKVTAPPFIDAVWAGLSKCEREQFAKRNLLAVWDAIDTVTK